MSYAKYYYPKEKLHTKLNRNNPKLGGKSKESAFLLRPDLPSQKPVHYKACEVMQPMVFNSKF